MIDGPYGDYGDRDGYRESCKRAMLLGCDGKWCIHPSQVEIANEVFAATKEQFEHAQRILEAYRQGVEGGRSAASPDGKMIDEASRKMAELVSAAGPPAWADCGVPARRTGTRPALAAGRSRHGARAGSALLDDLVGDAAPRRRRNGG